jgi:release factor glutamine methyltransferase
MPTFQTVLRNAEKLARSHHLEASAVKLLFLHFSKLSPTELYLSMDKSMPDSDYEAFEKAVHAYIFDNKPVQYLMGSVNFYGYQFIVDDRVLIPRFETEELVANVLVQYDEMFGNQNVRLVDVGTGSGCLAISLKMEEPHLTVFATDISEEALEVASENAKNIGAEITFLLGDMLKPLEGMKFDILVSNPPYIPTTENVDPMILKNEPELALFGGNDGLKFYEIILENAKSILNQKSFIAFEHGFDKAKEIASLAEKYFPLATVFTLKDMQNRDRMTFILNK